MSGSTDRPRADVVLVADGQRRFVIAIDRSVPCDLDLVDRLLLLRLNAQRRGWCLLFENVDGDLRELLDLVGVAAWLAPRTRRPEPWPSNDRR